MINFKNDNFQTIFEIRIKNDLIKEFLKKFSSASSGKDKGYIPQGSKFANFRTRPSKELIRLEIAENTNI
jgi:competence protein ComGF